MLKVLFLACFLDLPLYLATFFQGYVTLAKNSAQSFLEIFVCAMTTCFAKAIGGIMEEMSDGLAKDSFSLEIFDPYIMRKHFMDY